MRAVVRSRKLSFQHDSGTASAGLERKTAPALQTPHARVAVAAQAPPSHSPPQSAAAVVPAHFLSTTAQSHAATERHVHFAAPGADTDSPRPRSTHQPGFASAVAPPPTDVQFAAGKCEGLFQHYCFRTEDGLRQENLELLLKDLNFEFDEEYVHTVMETFASGSHGTVSLVAFEALWQQLTKARFDNFDEDGDMALNDHEVEQMMLQSGYDVNAEQAMQVSRNYGGRDGEPVTVSGFSALWVDLLLVKEDAHARCAVSSLPPPPPPPPEELDEPEHDVWVVRTRVDIKMKPNRKSPTVGEALTGEHLPFLRKITDRRHAWLGHDGQTTWLEIEWDGGRAYVLAQEKKQVYVQYVE